MKTYHLKREKTSHSPRDDICNTNPEEGSVSRIYKELQKSTNLKMERRLEQTFHKRGYQMTKSQQH